MDVLLQGLAIVRVRDAFLSYNRKPVCMPTCCISVRKINHCDIETVCISTLSKCKEDLSRFQNILFSLSAPTEHNASWEERSKPEVLCEICGGRGAA